MILSAKPKIYRILREYDALNEDEYKRKHPEDVWDDLLTNRLAYETEFEKVNEIDINNATIKLGITKGLPDKIVMFGWFDLLQKTELPSNNLNWTIISKRFLEVIKQLGFTEYRLIPIRVIDRTPFKYPADEEVRLYEHESTLQGLEYDDTIFYGFQVLTQLNVVTDESKLLENKIIWRNDIESLELPYFFREPKSLNELLVNQKARDALESAGIRGIRFIEPFSL